MIDPRTSTSSMLRDLVAELEDVSREGFQTPDEREVLAEGGTSGALSDSDPNGANL